MNYANIKNYDVADGPGVRVSLFVSGCRHHCKGCFNAETWDFHFGQPYTEETEAEILKVLYPGLHVAWRRAVRTRKPGGAGWAFASNQADLSEEGCLVLHGISL